VQSSEGHDFAGAVEEAVAQVSKGAAAGTGCAGKELLNDAHCGYSLRHAGRWWAPVRPFRCPDFRQRFSCT
jgi:hypothetical protein